MYATVPNVGDSAAGACRPWCHFTLGAFGLVACCTVTAGVTAQLWTAPITRPGVAVRAVGLPAGARVAPAFLQPSDMALAGALPQDLVYGEVQALPAPQAADAPGVYLGLLAMLGAAVALVWRQFPRGEEQAMLAASGLKDVVVQLDDDLDEVFTFHNLRSAPGSRHRKKRKGRGHGAGQGGTCGFGTRGQKSRKGRSVRAGFEGGQNPLWRRLPKLRGRPLGPGHPRIEYQMTSILLLGGEQPGATVTYEDRSGAKPVLYKVCGLKPGQAVDISNGLTVKAHAFTKTARSAIEAAGGKCVLIDKYSRELDAAGKVVQAEEKVAMVTMAGEVMYYHESEVESDVDEMDLEEDDSDVLSDAPAEIAMFAATAVRSKKVGKYKTPTPLTKHIDEGKKAIVAQVHESLKGSFLVFGVNADSFTMAQLTKLRKTMPAGVKVQVVKNTLFRMAARGTGFEALDPITMGSKAWVFVPEVCFQDAIKCYATFVKDLKKQETNPILGGATEGQLLMEAQVMALSELPTKQQLMAQVAGLIKSVPTRLATSVKEVPRRLSVAVRLATMPEEKKEGEAAAP